MTNLTAQQVIEAINAPALDAMQLLNPLWNPEPMTLAQWAAQAAQSNDDVTLWHYEILNGIYAGKATTHEFDAVVAEVKELI